jgi:hypothetical protein
VTGGSDEVEANMNTKIDLVCSAGLLLLKHVGLVLVVEEFDDGHPRIAVVHIVAEAGSVNDGQSNCTCQPALLTVCNVLTLEELLFQLRLGNFDFDSLVNLLCMPSLVVGVVLDGGGEERVDEGGLSEA